jgi:hypothetical protein
MCLKFAGGQAIADQEASNSVYIRAGTHGRLYAKCIPEEGYGSKGQTRIYLVRRETDELQFTFDWYANDLQLQGTALGTSVVRFGPWARGHEASDMDLALAFYLNGKLLKSYSTLEIAGTKKNVSASESHYTVFKTGGRYRWVDSNYHLFEIETVDDRRLAFDVDRGELMPRLDYIYANDREFLMLRSFTRQAKLGDEIAIRAYELRQPIFEESFRIYEDSSRTTEQKRAAMAALAARTRKQFMEILGAEAGADYVRYADSWLRLLEEGHSVRIRGETMEYRMLPKSEIPRPKTP